MDKNGRKWTEMDYCKKFLNYFKFVHCVHFCPLWSIFVHKNLPEGLFGPIFIDVRFFDADFVGFKTFC